jgi:putative hydrolase of the HAD superfamily
MKKAIIYDLDNTIYSVPSVGDLMFEPLFSLIKRSGKHSGDFEKIRDDIMRKPFQVVASHYHFDDHLTRQGIDLLQTLEYSGPIETFDDYAEIKKLTGDRFLVTTGFYKLQMSKIRGMKIEHDFKEINIVDPTATSKTKKDIFSDIVKKYQYQLREVLVVGDDLHSEIKAAQDLGIDAVHYDKYGRYQDKSSVPRISNFSELKKYL